MEDAIINVLICHTNIVIATLLLLLDTKIQQSANGNTKIKYWFEKRPRGNRCILDHVYIRKCKYEY